MSKFSPEIQFTSTNSDTEKITLPSMIYTQSRWDKKMFFYTHLGIQYSIVLAVQLYERKKEVDMTHRSTLFAIHAANMKNR